MNYTRVIYEKNQFRFYRYYNGNYLEIITVKSPLLVLPGSFAGYQDRKLVIRECPKIEGADQVKTIRLDKDTFWHPFHARQFPSLERLEVDPENPWFYTDGRCLYARQGAVLLSDPCQAVSHAPLTIERNVRSISQDAFYYSLCTSITFENPDISIDPNAFRHSRWLAAQTDPLVTAGSWLVKTNTDPRVLDLRAAGRSIQDISPSVFSGRQPPEEMYCEDLPHRMFSSVDDKVISSLKSLSLSSRAGISDGEDLWPYTGLASLSFWEEHPLYQVRDGILFSKDGKRLIYCPPFLPLSSYEVPEGVEVIEKYAFSCQAALAELSLPASLRGLGSHAFEYCKSLKTVRLPGELIEIPGAAFYGCVSLTRLTGGNALLRIGSKAFYQCPLKDYALPESLLRIGEKAFAESRASLRLPSYSAPAAQEGPSPLPPFPRCTLAEGAFYGVKEIHAQLPLPRDFVGALFQDELNYNNQHVQVWEGLTLWLKYPGEEREYPLIFPKEIRRRGKDLLGLILSQRCFRPADLVSLGFTSCIPDGTARAVLTFQAAGASPGEDLSSHLSYLRKVSRNLALTFLETRDLGSLRTLIDMDLCSKETLKLLQKKANEIPFPEASAYLLEKAEKERQKKKNPERKSVFPL